MVQALPAFFESCLDDFFSKPKGKVYLMATWGGTGKTYSLRDFIKKYNQTVIILGQNHPVIRENYTDPLQIPHLTGRRKSCTDNLGKIMMDSGLNPEPYCNKRIKPSCKKSDCIYKETMRFIFKNPRSFGSVLHMIPVVNELLSEKGALFDAVIIEENPFGPLSINISFDSVDLENSMEIVSEFSDSSERSFILDVGEELKNSCCSPVEHKLNHDFIFDKIFETDYDFEDIISSINKELLTIFLSNSNSYYLRSNPIIDMITVFNQIKESADPMEALKSCFSQEGNLNFRSFDLTSLKSIKHGIIIADFTASVCFDAYKKIFSDREITIIDPETGPGNLKAIQLSPSNYGDNQVPFSALIQKSSNYPYDSWFTHTYYRLINFIKIICKIHFDKEILIVCKKSLIDMKATNRLNRQCNYYGCKPNMGVKYQLEDILNFPDGSERIHITNYGSLRGLNKYESSDVVILLGAFNPKPEVLRTFVSQLGVTYKEAESFFREAEMLQAIERVRSFFKTYRVRPSINTFCYILSSVPLDKIESEFMSTSDMELYLRTELNRVKFAGRFNAVRECLKEHIGGLGVSEIEVNTKMSNREIRRILTGLIDSGEVLKLPKKSTENFSRFKLLN